MASQQVALRFSQHPPAKSSANILLLGMEGIGKGILAKTIVDSPASFNINCHTATTLDQIREVGQKNRIDYIVFIVDTSRRISLDNIRLLLEYIDVEYYLGRSCFVAVRRGGDLIHEDEALMEVAQGYGVSVVFTSTSTESDVAACAASVVRMAGVAAGMSPGVTSVLLG